MKFPARRLHPLPIADALKRSVPLLTPHWRKEHRVQLRERAARMELQQQAEQQSAAQELAKPQTENFALSAPALVTLRAELEHADEATWRTRLIELNATGQDALVAVLMEDFRARFNHPPSLTLDDIVHMEENRDE